MAFGSDIQSYDCVRKSPHLRESQATGSLLGPPVTATTSTEVSIRRRCPFHRISSLPQKVPLCGLHHRTFPAREIPPPRHSCATDPQSYLRIVSHTKSGKSLMTHPVIMTKISVLECHKETAASICDRGIRTRGRR